MSTDEQPRFFEHWAAIKASGAQLTSTERWILTVMLGHVNFYHEDGRIIWPSDATLAKQAAVSRRTIRTCRAKFHDEGLISWSRKPGRSNDTFIDLNSILALADDPTTNTHAEEE